MTFLVPSPDGELSGCYSTTKVHDRPPAMLLTSRREGVIIMLVLCSWCPGYNGQHIKYSNTVDQLWKELTPSVVGIIAKAPSQISHGICPECAKRWHDEYKQALTKERTAHQAQRGLAVVQLARSHFDTPKRGA